MKHTILEEEETDKPKQELERAPPPQSEGKVRAGRVHLEPA